MTCCMGFCVYHLSNLKEQKDQSIHPGKNLKKGLILPFYKKHSRYKSSGIKDLAVIDLNPPEEFWDDIMKLRNKYVAYMPYDAPHISFLNPFVISDEVDSAVKIVENRLKYFPPFEISFLPELKTFPHNVEGVTIYAEPVTNPPGQLQVLNSIIMDLFPQCMDMMKKFKEYRPHLTLAQFPDQDSYREELPYITENWKSFRYQLNEIHFYVRNEKRYPFISKGKARIGKSLSINNKIITSNLIELRKRSCMIVGLDHSIHEKDFENIIITNLKDKYSIQGFGIIRNLSIRDWCCAVILNSSESMANLFIKSDYPFPSLNGRKIEIYSLYVSQLYFDFNNLIKIN